MNLKRILKYGLCGATALALLIGGASGSSAAKLPEQLPSYRTVTEVFDWGPSVSKLIVNLGTSLTSDQVDKSTFKVYVRRVLAEGAMTPAEASRQSSGGINLGSESKSDSDLQGYRNVVNAYVSDADGNSVKRGNYVTIEMYVAPDDNLGAALNFDLNTYFNNWVKSEYTITLNKKLGSLKNIVIDNCRGDIRPIVDKFSFSHKIFDEWASYAYASYEPKDNLKHPLIIWLHGLGEGGTDSPSLPIMGNKADMFADESLQSHFDGAYVLVPQCRTFWMQGHSGLADGTSVYKESLMSLIKAYVAEHPNIDTDRIYLGGDSNGGYMTMVLVRDYPKYFAAAFPTCEALRDDLISDADLRNIAQTPIWFTAAKTDLVVPPNEHVVPTVARLRAINADVHFSYFDDVHDMTGLYKKADGSAYEYPGHFSWIYVYNDQCEDIINGKSVKLMDWLAAQKLRR